MVNKYNIIYVINKPIVNGMFDVFLRYNLILALIDM